MDKPMDIVHKNQCNHLNSNMPILEQPKKTQGVLNSSSKTFMPRVGHYEIKPPIYKKFIEKNICIRINGKLEINSCICTKLLI